MSKKITTIMKVLGMLLLILVSGCKKEAKKDQGKVVKIAIDSEIFTLDYALSLDGVSSDVIDAFGEGLYVLNSSGKSVPGLAKSYEVSDDKLTYTFHLRENLKWSDGRDLKAKDFVFGWRRGISPEVAAGMSYMYGVAGVKNANAIINGEKPVESLGIEAPDENTVVVTLDRPVSFFLSLLNDGLFYPLNEEFYNSVGDQYALEPKDLITCGPYKVVDWKKGYGVNLTKNEYYYNKENIDIDRLEYRVIKDPQTAVLKFESNELDVVKLSAELSDKYADSPNRKEMVTKYLWYITMNTKFKDMDNRNLRKAMNYAIDKNYITKHIMRDGSIRADFIIPRNFATSPEGKDFRDETTEFYKGEKKEAQKYWNKAKEEMGVEEVTLELLFDDFETVKKMAEYIQSEVETTLPGVKVVLKSQPKKNRAQLMFDGNYQMGLNRWGVSYDDPQAYLEIFEKSSVFNFPNYDNPKFNKLMNDVSKGELTRYPQKRWEALIEGEKMIMDDAAIVPLFQRGNVFLVREGLEGFRNYPANSLLVYRELKKN